MSARGGPQFFVVAAPRSGAVRLGSILAAHPDVAMLERTQWLLRISSGGEHPGSGRTVSGELLRNAPELSALGLADDELRELTDLGDRPSLASVLEHLALVVARRHDRSVVGDRTEFYLRCIPLLHSEWPQARILHLIRDGRRIYRSMLAAGETTDPCQAALEWEWNVRVGREGGGALPEGFYAEVRHEELTTDPERALARVGEFLHLAPGPAEAGPRKTSRGDRPGAGRGSGMVRLDSAARELFEAVAGSLLDELGYELSVPRPGRAAVERARLAREKFTRRRRLKRDVLPADWPDTTVPAGGGLVVVEPSRPAASATGPETAAWPFSDCPRFFVVGAPESGTVRVGSILESHPDVAMMVRTHWLLRLSSGEGIPGSPRTISTDAVLAAADFVRLGLGEGDREQLRALGNHADLASVFERLARLVAVSRERTIVGDRTEHYLRCIGFLHATWPQARIVHVIRDGRRIYRSMVTSGEAVDPCEAALDWEWNVRLGRDAGKDLPSGLYAEVRHEELIADPDSGYASLSSFLGLPYQPELARQHLKRLHRGRAREMVKPDRAAIELFEASAGSLLDELGFRRTVPRPGVEATERARRAREQFTGARLVDGDPLPSDWPCQPPPASPSPSGDRSEVARDLPPAARLAPGAFGKKERSVADALGPEELPRDPAFPRMADLFDPDWVEAWLGEDLRTRTARPVSWRVGFVRYRPARDLIVGYRPAAELPDGMVPVLLVSAVGRQDLDRRRRLSGLDPASPDSVAPGFHFRADASAVATMFPNDPVFGGISVLLNPDSLEASLRRASTEDAGLVRRQGRADIVVASYKPASSCLARCEVAGPNGRQRSVFARVYRDDSGAWVHRVMTALWDGAGGGDRADAGLARVIGYDGASRILFQEAVAGTLLPTHSDLPALAARVAEPLLRTHATAISDENAPIDDPVRRLSLAAVGLHAAVPEIGEQLDRLVSLLRSSRPSVRPVLIHGDFSPNQVLVDGDSVSIIDFDLARLGDRHADVASFLTRLETQDLPPEIVRAACEQFRESYEAEGGPLEDAALAWYRACALGSIALYAVKALRPGWKRTAIAHLARAAEALEI